MKTRLAVALIVTGVLLYPLYPVFAENTATSSRTPKMTFGGDAMVFDPITGDGRPTNEIRKEKMATREALLKARLQKFRDQNKAQTVERINTMLKTVNSNRTTAMLNHLNTLSNILTKVESRVNEVSQNGKDATSAKSAIQNAKTTIDSAKQLVTAQQQKEYSVQVNTEATVRTDAKAARDQLFIDLKTAHEAVTKAKDALIQAIQTSVQTLGGTNGK